MARRTGLAQIVVDFVNGAVGSDPFFRRMNEAKWIIEGQQTPNGAVLPMISNVDELASVRVFTSDTAAQTFMDHQPEGTPRRPFKRDRGCDLFGPMPPAVQQVIVDAASPIALSITAEQRDSLQLMGSAVMAETMLMSTSGNLATIARTMLSHRGYVFVTVEGHANIVDDQRGGAIAFTHRDCADAWVSRRGASVGNHDHETLAGPEMFRKLATLSTETVVWNPDGPAPTVVLPMAHVRAVARVNLIE